MVNLTELEIIFEVRMDSDQIREMVLGAMDFH